MPADEQIELTVTYSDESAETRELFYGKKGIIHRFMELTPEVKLEYARNSAKSSSTRSLNRQNCNSLRPGFPTYMEWQWNHRKVERVHITDYRWLNFVHEIGGVHGQNAFFQGFVHKIGGICGQNLLWKSNPVKNGVPVCKNPTFTHGPTIPCVKTRVLLTVLTKMAFPCVKTPLLLTARQSRV